MFSRLFKTKTFTDSWKRKENLNLTFELSDNSLNSIRLGDYADLLSFLGISEYPQAVNKKSTLYYFSLGLAVSFESNSHKILEYRLIWLDYLSEGFAPFPGTMTLHGRPISDSVLVSQNDIVEKLGKPSSSDRDEEEEVLYYKNRSWEWDFEFTLDGHLKHFVAFKE